MAWGGRHGDGGIHTGARDVRQRTWAAGTVLVPGAAASVLLSSVGIICSPTLARFMGAKGRLLDLILVYLRVTRYLFSTYVFLHLAAAIFQGVGDTRTPLKAMVGVNILHVLLAVPLIYGRWGAPRLGVAGAALTSGVAKESGAVRLLWGARRCGILGPIGWNVPELWRVLRVGLRLWVTGSSRAECSSSSPGSSFDSALRPMRRTRSG